MREIEFRAWLKNIEKMVEVEEINFIYKEVRFKDYETPFTKPIEINVSFEDVELMQYTGLKDKNGVKIFDGDIVKRNIIEIYQVGWNDKESCWYIFRKDIGVKHNFSDISTLINNVKNFEVIGNIYENKELLENV